MPLVNSPIGTTNPSIEMVLNIARARVNDMMNSVDGDLLTDDMPATQAYLNAAWRWLQGECGNSGIATFKKTVVLSGIPLRASDDTANPSFITKLGCSDGYNEFDTPALPQDMISPLSFWRRPTQVGVNTSEWCLMTQATDGLPVWLDPNVYSWEADGLYFYGNTMQQDFRIRYQAYYPDLDISHPDNEVPMMFAEDCLGSRVAFEFANARGAAQAPQIMQWSLDGLDTIKKRHARQTQRQNIRRQPYGGRGGGSYNRFPYVIGS